MIWFEESNSWIQFEEPAYFIYKLYSKGTGIPEIDSRFQKRYSLSQPESRQFINDIIAGIRQSSAQTDKYDSLIQDKNKPVNYAPVARNIHSYLINQKVINIEFETDPLGFYIHPLFSHLEIPITDLPDFCFEIFMMNDKFILRHKTNPEFTWAFDEINKLKGKLFVEISNKIYNKTEESWMSVIHASAVRDMNQTVLLPSSSGCGKSTMAALLLKYGLELVSDDYVPVEAGSKKAYPFPAAIALKTPSFNLFTFDKLAELNYHGLKNRSVKYLVPEIKGKSWYYPYPVRKIVFVKYNPVGQSEFSKLPVLSALKLFLDQAKVSTRYKNAKRFINWFIEIESYKLEYSDKQWAVNKILELFKK